MITKDTIYAVSIIFFIGFIIYTLVKKWSLSRIIKFGMIFFYIVALISVTVFPIPINKRYIAEAAIPARNNFIPFHGIYELIKYSKTFKMVLLIPLVGNIFLFIPFGFFLRMKAPILKFQKILLLGLLASLAVEMSQLIISVTIHFLYRSIDVDDLICNTIGTVVGFYMCNFLVIVIRSYKNESNIAKFILAEFFNS